MSKPEMAGAARWDARYAEEGWAYGTQPNDFVVEVADRIPKGRVLCIGDGEGRNGVWLASRGFDVTSLDQSKIGMEKAARFATERGVALTTLVRDLDGWDFEPKGWSAVVSIFCHLPSELRRRVHRAAAAALAPGGAFVLEAYAPEQLEYKTGGPPVRDLLVTPDDLRADVAGGGHTDLAIELLEQKVRLVHEGSFHDGQSAVVRLLAFRR
jgi:SAM-dependent methyltransferase